MIFRTLKKQNFPHKFPQKFNKYSQSLKNFNVNKQNLREYSTFSLAVMHRYHTMRQNLEQIE